MVGSIGIGMLLALMFGLLFIYPAIYGLWRKVEYWRRFSFVSAGSFLAVLYIMGLIFTPLEVVLINEIPQFCYENRSFWFCGMASWLDNDSSIMYWALAIVLASIVPHILYIKYWVEYESCLAVNK